MFTQSSSKKKKGSQTELSEAETVQLVGLLAKIGVSPVTALLGTSASGTTRVPGGKPPPGYYYDPKSGKTFKQRKPMKHSQLRDEAELLVKRAVKIITDYCINNKITATKEHGVYVYTGEAGAKIGKIHLDRLEELKRALDNAKLQLAQVKLAERAKAKKKKGQPSEMLDPLKLPQLQVDEGGKKLRWADIIVKEAGTPPAKT